MHEFYVVIGDGIAELEEQLANHTIRKNRNALRRKRNARHKLEERGVPGTVVPYCELKNQILENWKSPPALDKIRYRAKRFGDDGTFTGTLAEQRLKRSCNKEATRRELRENLNEMD